MPYRPTLLAAADAAFQDWLRELCRRADEVLGAVTASPWARPVRHGRASCSRRRARYGGVRAQEARFAFVAALLAEPDPEPWAFAAEVPTRLSYRFAGRGAAEKAQKALTDLALDRHGHDEPALAVEFKSGGRSGRSEIDEGIRKDVAEDLAEPRRAVVPRRARRQHHHSPGAAAHPGRGGLSLSSPVRLSDYLAAGKTVEPRAKNAPRLRAQRRADRVHPRRARLRARQAQA